jgi:hypothetical protein
VTVTDVNTSVLRGKDKRMGRGYAKLRNWKKAIVTLKKGDEIKFFDEEGRSSHGYQIVQADLAGQALLFGQRLQGNHEE